MSGAAAVPRGLEFLDLDHAVLRVGDLGSAVARFERFGFTLAPPRQRPASAPNPVIEARHILFQPYPGRSDLANFVVFQSLRDPAALSDVLARIFSFMLDSEGTKAVVAYAPDVDVSKARMRAAGMTTNDAEAHSEGFWYDEATGTELPVRVRQLAMLTRRMPFVVNGFHTETLGSFRHPAWTQHANGARYLAGVTGVSANLGQDVATMAGAVFGVEPEWLNQDIAVIRPRDLFLRIVSPHGFAQLYPGLDRSSEQVLPAYVGVTFAVASADQVRGVLTERGVPHQTTSDGRVLVARAQAHNSILEFVEIDQMKEAATA